MTNSINSHLKIKVTHSELALKLNMSLRYIWILSNIGLGVQTQGLRIQPKKYYSLLVLQFYLVRWLYFYIFFLDLSNLKFNNKIIKILFQLKINLVDVDIMLWNILILMLSIPCSLSTFIKRNRSIKIAL